MSYYIFKSNRTKIILTPMIDVLFIILIFFMLVSNFNLNRGISLQSGSSSEASLSRHTLAIVDLNEIRISLNGVEVERNFLVQKLHKLSKNNDEIQIFLRPSGEFSVQNIIDLIDELTAEGLSNIYILD
tara:strand:+ start:202 stop:588 length:387 start_codon:yes stop_codon:yes gene_type:complete